MTAGVAVGGDGAGPAVVTAGVGGPSGAVTRSQ